MNNKTNETMEFIKLGVNINKLNNANILISN